jgi:hypothetical protein
MLVLLVALAVALRGDERAARWARLPLLMGLCSTTFLIVAPVPPRGHDYYFWKTHLHAVLLLVPALAALAARLVEARPSLLPRLGIGGATIAICAALGLAFAPWRVNQLERAFGRPPFTHLRPMADLHAWRRIDRVLAERKKTFGGYLSSFYPLMNFMNTSFGFWNGGIDFYWGKAPREGVGRCVFWERCRADLECLEPGWPQTWRVLALDANPATQCEAYTPAWNPARRRVLCWKCD